MGRCNTRHFQARPLDLSYPQHPFSFPTPWLKRGVEGFQELRGGRDKRQKDRSLYVYWLRFLLFFSRLPESDSTHLDSSVTLYHRNVETRKIIKGEFQKNGHIGGIVFEIPGLLT